MSELIKLADHRAPVCYTIRITHYWDDGLGVLVEDIGSDPRSRKSAAEAMRRAADLIERGEPEETTR